MSFVQRIQNERQKHSSAAMVWWLSAVLSAERLDCKSLPPEGSFSCHIVNSAAIMSSVHCQSMGRSEGEGGDWPHSPSYAKAKKYEVVRIFI